MLITQLENNSVGIFSVICSICFHCASKTQCKTFYIWTIKMQHSDNKKGFFFFPVWNYQINLNWIQETPRIAPNLIFFFFFLLNIQATYIWVFFTSNSLLIYYYNKQKTTTTIKTRRRKTSWLNYLEFSMLLANYGTKACLIRCIVIDDT